MVKGALAGKLLEQKLQVQWAQFSRNSTQAEKKNTSLCEISRIAESVGQEQSVVWWLGAHILEENKK